jgi:alkylation response protein AidB-like acyl-CoA dehydrogenase
VELDFLRRETRRVLADRFSVQRMRAAIDAAPSRDFVDARAGLGWTGALAPSDHGGEGLALAGVSVIAEEHGRALFPASLEATAALTSVVQPELLGEICAGRTIVTWAGAQAVDSITAVTTAQGVRLDGIAVAVHDAQVSDALLVTARRPEGGFVRAVVPVTAAGLEVAPISTLDVTRRFARVTLTGVTVDDVVVDVDGEEHQRMLDVATVVACADATGAARALLERSVQYARERQAFGRPIAAYQVIKHKCADMLSAAEGCEVVTRWAARSVQGGSAGASTAVSIAKAFVSDAASRVAGESQQIHGGIGFTWEHDVHLFLRRIKTDAAMYGTAAWHRERIADAVIRDAYGDRS